MGWFKRRGRPQPEPPRLHTNAPDHWPVPDVELEQGPRAGTANAQRLANGLAAAFAGHDGDLRVEGVLERVLFPRGILEIHALVRDGERSVPVFAFGTANAEAAAIFQGCREGVEHLTGVTPVYYAPAPLPDAEAASPLVLLRPDMLRRAAASKEGEHATWWPTPAEPTFADSVAADALSRAYAALDGYESFALAPIAAALGIVDGKPVRVALPDEPATVAVEGPEREVFLLSIGAEKGMRFHFPVSDAGVHYRDRFLENWADFAEDARRQLEALGAPRDAHAEGSPRGWFDFARETLRGNEAQGKETTRFGVILPRPA